LPYERDIKITVYIVSQNYGKYLSHAIESVLRQTVDNWELLIFNDNSTDNTGEVLNLYRGDERIRIFETEGIGFIRSANIALKNSGGRYLIRLDADDIFDENILLVLSNYLDKNPDISLVFPDFYYIDEGGNILSQTRISKIFEVNHILDKPPNGACTMIRKSVLEEIGGYREDLGAQDGFDIWTRLIDKYKSANINLPLFYYRRHGNNLTSNMTRILSARRQIKKDAVADILDSYRPLLMVIPVRRNYDFITDLWKEKIGDKTLLEISIDSSISSELPDYIVVTSDNEEVLDIMKKYNDSRLKYVYRPQDLTIRSRSITFSLENILKKLKLDYKGIMVLNYIQAPFNTRETFEELIYTLIMNNATSIIAVEELGELILKRNSWGLSPVNLKSSVTSDFDILYRETRTLVGIKSSNLKTGSFAGNKIINFVVPKEEGLFINSYNNLLIAKILSENLHKKTAG